MPKEYVFSSDRFVPETSDSPDMDGPPVVVVGWSREHGDVEIVTRLRDAEMFSVDEAESIPVKYGMHVWLDRQGINDLIRHLRRARDQAFGRDE